MKAVILIAATACLAACSKPVAPAADDGNRASANDAAAQVAIASPILETSWEFTEDGKLVQESVDASAIT